MVLTPLTEGKDSSVHTFLAGTYDSLADSPSENRNVPRFSISAVIAPRISVAVHGDDWKQADIENTLTEICNYEIELMGGAPFKRYLFIFHIGKAAQGAGGGMEHADGTAINLRSGAQIAGVSAHEFFHLWNVKRIWARFPGADRLHARAVQPCAVVRRRRQQYLWRLHPGALGHLVEA